MKTQKKRMSRNAVTFDIIVGRRTYHGRLVFNPPVRVAPRTTITAYVTT